MPCAELQTFTASLSPRADVSGLIDTIAAECCTHNGFWNLPSDPASAQPALYEIQLHGIDASGLTVEEAARNWLKIARDALAQQEAA